MAASYIIERACAVDQTCEIAFAGDSVRLAGQMDYPQSAPALGSGYPLIFTLHHAGWKSRDDYRQYAQVALNSGYAVFRWDKRGMGRSGAGGRGSTTQDAVNAYETALSQSNIDHKRVVILAQGEGTMMLGSAFGLFARVQQPAGVILVGNMLDETAVLAINSRLQIIQGEHDWNLPSDYALAPAANHAKKYSHGAAFYVARDASRELTVGQGDSQAFHFGAAHTIRDWLKSIE
jgi:pimeloyl-ACP methyl ester carboxylesterase